MHRPRSLTEYHALDGFMSDESLQRGLTYEPAPSDIFISPYAKCGTTWTQQIVHGLRSGGSMAFEEITEVVPWLELAYDMGTDPQTCQVAQPRVFKSHLRWDQIPKGGRYIVVLRDPVDAMVSLLRFLDGWFFESGSIPLDDFAEDYLERGEDGYWDHMASWWSARQREDVLLLCFEDMKDDLRAAVDQIADHMQQGYDAERRDLATWQASFDFMKAHAAQFDDRLVRRNRDPVMGLPPSRASGKVATGKTKAPVPDKIRAAFDLKWKDTLGKTFGLSSYDALRKELPKVSSG